MVIQQNWLKLWRHCLQYRVYQKEVNSHKKILKNKKYDVFGKFDCCNKFMDRFSFSVYKIIEVRRSMWILWLFL